ncbi:MAG: hypothetical protein JW910_10430, partial [Anaerolineae bacterium]|nr:hypothetical protein [Anaerolineae bacterium]
MRMQRQWIVAGLVVALTVVLTACGGVSSTDQVTLAAPNTAIPPTPTLTAPPETPTPETITLVEPSPDPRAAASVITPLPADLAPITPDNVAHLEPLAEWALGFGGAHALGFNRTEAGTSSLLGAADMNGWARVLDLAQG